MRTTLDIDPDVLQAAKEIAAREKASAGRVLSDLARRALTAREGESVRRNGVPLLPSRAGSGIVTSETVRRLQDDD